MEFEWLDSWTPDCAARHIGLWLIEPLWFREAAAAVKARVWEPRPADHRYPHIHVPSQRSEVHGPDGPRTPPALEAKARPTPEEPQEKPYPLDGSGIAIIPIDGQMMKGSSKYGGANTIDIRRQIRMATHDPDVRGIMLAIDSPGGTVAGTEELGADVLAARAVKPTFAHVDDLGASAAYWVASQSSRITASATSEIGSIGTMAVIEDFSENVERKGIKVHVISTGPYKGAGVEGTPITDEHLAYLQDRVDAINQHFLDAVSRGRNVPLVKVQDWADGRVWIAQKAKQMGMIDEVMRFDEAMDSARSIVEGQSGNPKETKSAKRDTRSATRLAELKKIFGIDQK